MTLPNGVVLMSQQNYLFNVKLELCLGFQYATGRIRLYYSFIGAEKVRQQGTISVTSDYDKYTNLAKLSAEHKVFHET